MTKKRQEEIKKEITTRIELWLTNSSFEDMTMHGSFMRFEMALGLAGYPFEKEIWMKENQFESFLTKNEFDSSEYNKIVRAEFDILILKNV